MKDYEKVRIALIEMLEELEQSLDDVSKTSSLVEHCDNDNKPKLSVKNKKLQSLNVSDNKKKENE